MILDVYEMFRQVLNKALDFPATPPSFGHKKDFHRSFSQYRAESDVQILRQRSSSAGQFSTSSGRELLSLARDEVAVLSLFK
jgi:hypothetical protein